MLDGLTLPSVRSTTAARWELDPLDQINQGLLAFLPLNEPGGRALLDLSGRQRTAALVGTVGRRVSPKIGRVTNFATTSDYGLISNGKTISGQPQWTIAVWMRVASGYNSFAGCSYYCERASSGNDIVKLDSLSTGLGGSFATSAYLTIRDDAGTLIQGCVGSTTINDGQWHFLVGTKNGSALSFYIDGKRENTATWAGSDTFTNAVDSRVAGDAGFASGGAQGDYAGLRLFRRAITPGEVARLYRDPWAGAIDPSARLFVAFRAPSTSIAGTLTATLGNATLSATGAVAIAGTSAPTLAAATLSATGTLTISGAASATLAAITGVAAGTVALTGALSVTLDAATLAADGTSASVVTGTLAVTLDAATLAAASTLVLRGTTTTTLANATLAGTGTLSLRATSSVTLGNVALSATGTNGNVVNAIVLVWNGVRI